MKRRIRLTLVILLIITALLLFGCRPSEQQQQPGTYEKAYAQAVSMGYEGSLNDFIAVLKGDSGESAYQTAVKLGFEGTEAEWLLSLQGKSAYELAVENGYEGTEAEWLDALIGSAGARGEDGLSAYEIAAVQGFEGSEAEWLLSLIGASGETGEKGEQGLTAYEIAVGNGFEGSEGEWLTSLIGARGEDGKSAYDIAVLGGFEGTESQWLVSLIGETGPAGETDISSIIEGNNLLDSVIEIHASIEGGEGGLSSGIIISADGYILTNAHCVSYETEEEVPQTLLYDEILGIFRDSEVEYSLEVVHYDLTKDLAVVKFTEAPAGLVAVTIGDSNALSIGDTSIVIGNAIGFGITASSGIIADTVQDYDVEYMEGIVEAVRTDSPVNPGNSGGALFNGLGQLIGVVTFKIAPSSLYEGLGFGISSNFAKAYIDSVIAEKQITISYIRA
ncbi:MAG: trypsin-like peptidase domain-containing protein [Clostridia bacterium]|nr:trypsin-like peptidase domain-containing protein [Clostridia bacterium]